ncbi:MAG TPA: ComEA family DNA-binding protein [Candidatus Aphodovivens avicola]|nr:ComEA family DNA-binding protein [Candidatus Aphodovivens avicola]
MSFQESAESLRSKLHLTDRLSVPVLVGICAVIVIGIAIAGYSLLGGLSSDSFSFGVGEDGATVEVEGLELMDAAEAEGAGGRVAPTIAVHVSGAVAAPGVYELEEGARVADAVEHAGGFLEGAAENALNLARVLNDGEQVVVPTAEEQAAQQSAAEASGGAAGVGGKVNINTASVEQLDTLPGVGESTAQKIIADREANGPFSSPEDLKRVSGIGDKKYAELADLITVG